MLVLVVRLSAAPRDEKNSVIYELILGVRHCAKCIICIVSLDLGNNPIKNVLKIIKRAGSVAQR